MSLRPLLHSHALRRGRTRPLTFLGQARCLPSPEQLPLSAPPSARVPHTKRHHIQGADHDRARADQGLPHGNDAPSEHPSRQPLLRRRAHFKQRPPYNGRGTAGGGCRSGGRRRARGGQRARGGLPGPRLAPSGVRRRPPHDEPKSDRRPALRSRFYARRCGDALQLAAGGSWPLRSSTGSSPPGHPTRSSTTRCPPTHPQIIPVPGPQIPRAMLLGKSAFPLK